MVITSGWEFRLIATADAYNHHIPTEHVTLRSVGRLVASGLATTSGLRATLTRKGRSLAKRARGGMFERARKLLILLEQEPLREGQWLLPATAWQTAYDEYRSRLSKYM